MTPTQISADHKPTLVEQSNTLLQIYSNEALQLKMMPIWEQEKAQVRFSLMEKESQKLGRPLRASSTERVRKQADVQFNEYLHGVSESARRDGVATGTLLGAGITGVFVAPIATAVGYGVGEAAEYGAKKLGASEGVAGAAGLFAGVLGGAKASTYTLSLAQKRMLGALIKNSQSVIGKTATQKLSSLVHNAKMSVKPGAQSVEADCVKSSLQGQNLQRYLASNSQILEEGVVIAGEGIAKLKDAPRLVAQYGGTVEQWVKKKSSNFTSSDTLKFEVHWYENMITKERIEFKTKFTDPIIKNIGKK